MLKNKHIVLVFAYVISLVFLISFVDRSQFLLLIGAYSVSFVAYIFLLKNTNSWKWIFPGAVIVRLASFFVLPHFSDDYFRFLWDGMITVSGGNPYLNVPSNEVLHQLPLQAVNWLKSMNSPNYYTVYPPFLQWLFAAMYWLGNGNEIFGINVFRGVIIAFEILVFWMAKNRTSTIGQKVFRLLPWLICNPLYLVETFGNIHAEALVVLLLIIAYLFFEKDRLLIAASFFSVAIATKILPLIALPLLIKKLNFKQIAVFVITGIIVLSIFSYRFIELTWISNQFASLELYFINFEFNASLYFIIRAIGYQFVGYNIIQTVGLITPWVVLLIVVYLQCIKSWSKHSVLNSIFYSVFFYYLFSSIVHPWYAIYLILPAVVIRSSAGLLWSYLIMFSYVFYQVGDTWIYYLLIALEYGVLFLAFIFESDMNKWLKLEKTTSF